MSRYSDNIEKYRAYRQAKAARRKSDAEVEEYLKSTMPDTFKAIQDGVKKNKEPYNHTKEEKAKYLYREYRSYDQNHGLKFDLTEDWILKHIVNGKCAYCGCDDWVHLGTDRLDNSSGHTKVNVVCCCEGCNNRRNNTNLEDWIRKSRKWGNLSFWGEIWLRMKIFIKKFRFRMYLA